MPESVPDPYRQIAAADEVHRAVWAALGEVEDPELPVSVVDLGLVYGVSVEDGHATVEMTLTYSGCPAREMILDDARRAVESVPSVESAAVRLVYSPPWTFERVTDPGRDALSEWGLAVPEAETSAGATCEQ